MTDLPLFANPSGEDSETGPGRTDDEARNFFPAAAKEYRDTEFHFATEPTEPTGGDTFGALKEAIRREWNLPIGRQVGVVLRGIDGSLNGVLQVAGYPDKIDRRSRLHLRIGKAEFLSTEIETCTVIHDTTP